MDILSNTAHVPLGVFRGRKELDDTDRPVPRRVFLMLQSNPEVAQPVAAVVHEAAKLQSGS
jgi:hypothetical protein